MKDCFAIPRRYLGLSASYKSGGRGVMSWIAQVSVLQATPWRSSQAPGDCPMATLHPKHFLRWENSPGAVFQLAFLALYFRAPVLEVTGHLLSVCCAGLCWQTLAIREHLSGTGTVTRSVTTTACAEQQLPWRLPRVAATFEVSVGLALAAL